MNDRWMDRLSDYLDGELNPADRGALEAHLATCATCAATLAELERVVARARALENRAPAADLWAGVAARIGVGTGAVVDIETMRARRARRVTFSVPQLIAASVALVLLSGGAMWLALGSRGAAPGTVEIVSESGAAGLVTVDWEEGGGGTQAAARYDRAIGQLEQALAAGRGRLDSATIRVLETSLGRIDRAIDEARRALADDPASTYLNDHLTRTMRRKLELLRQAALLTRAES